jgi:hypothetical protein
MNLGLAVDPSVTPQLRGMNLPTLGPGSCVSSSHATGKHVCEASTFAPFPPPVSICFFTRIASSHCYYPHPTAYTLCTDNTLNISS